MLPGFNERLTSELRLLGTGQIVRPPWLQPSDLPVISLQVYRMLAFEMQTPRSRLWQCGKVPRLLQPKHNKVPRRCRGWLHTLSMMPPCCASLSERLTLVLG